MANIIYTPLKSLHLAVYIPVAEVNGTVTAVVGVVPITDVAVGIAVPGAVVGGSGGQPIK